MVVISAGGRLVQKRSWKEMGQAETKCDVFVLFAFSDQFKFGSGMRTRNIRMRSNGNGAGASVHSIVFRGEPNVIDHLVEGPLRPSFSAPRRGGL